MYAPDPGVEDFHIFDRMLKFLLRLAPDRPVRRLDWTMTVNPRFSACPEPLPFWGLEDRLVTPANVGEKVHLRVDLQAFFRLPCSNAILLSVRSYLLSLNEVVRVPKWARRLHRVLKSLDMRFADYKEFAAYRDVAVGFLARFDDGAPTSRGTYADCLALDPAL
jgi:hypothetical protein